MNITGIICEYNPLHLGHKRQMDLIRAKHEDTAIVSATIWAAIPVNPFILPIIFGKVKQEVTGTKKFLPHIRTFRHIFIFLVFSG